MKKQSDREFQNRKEDRDTAATLKRHLDHEGHGQLRRIRCNVQQGTAILWGNVATEEDRDLAIEIAADCPKVDGVIDQIQVRKHAVAAAV